MTVAHEQAHFTIFDLRTDLSELGQLLLLMLKLIALIQSLTLHRVVDRALLHHEALCSSHDLVKRALCRHRVLHVRDFRQRCRHLQRLMLLVGLDPIFRFT